MNLPRDRFVGVAILTATLLSAVHTEAQEIPELRASRRGSFEFGEEDGNTNLPVKVWYYRPATITQDTRVVMVMHGGGRKGKEARDLAAKQAEHRNLVILAPEFREDQLNDDLYSFANMIDRNGQRRPRSAWLFNTIEQLFDYVRGRVELEGTTYDIFGHSAGGQFVHRLVLFYPEGRYRRAVASGCGRYALPTMRVEFPYGLGGSTTDEQALAKAFSRDFVLLVGERDTVDHDRETAARAQGSNRLARGLRFFAWATEEASEMGVPLAWRLRVLNGVTHSLEAATEAGFEELFR